MPRRAPPAHRHRRVGPLPPSCCNTRRTALRWVLARAWGADLIVLGTHGRRGLARVLMGSDAEQIARTAPVPVLLVRLPAGADGSAASA